MDELEVKLPDGGGDGVEYEYSTMACNYRRWGKHKDTITRLEFGDAHAWYGATIMVGDEDGKMHGPYKAEKVVVELQGEFEAHDLINFFRKVVHYHDMQRFVMHGVKPETYADSIASVS